jgi:prolipoprotein diacylglyceryl transferase
VIVLPLLIPSPDISSFDLGPIRIRFYALFILAGIVAAIWITSRRLKKAGANGEAAVDVAFWAVLFGIVGARFYHVVTHPSDYFFDGADLLKTLYIWEGGIAIFGAVVFGAIGIYFGTRRAGIPFLVFADALVPGLLLAQAIGRLGNYFNQELFGTPTTLPWGLQIDPNSPAFPPDLPVDTLFHPLFLYELLWNLAGVAVILLLSRRKAIGSGVALGIYLLWYGLGRAWFETFRLDPSQLEILGIDANIITAVIAAMLGVLVVVREIRREKVQLAAVFIAPATSAGPDSANVHRSDNDSADAQSSRPHE